MSRLGDDVPEGPFDLDTSEGITSACDALTMAAKKTGAQPVVAVHLLMAAAWRISRTLQQMGHDRDEYAEGIAIIGETTASAPTPSDPFEWPSN
jgi:hypothetical protein